MVPGELASAANMDFHLKIDLVGVPAHLWLRSTAQEILGSSCSIIAMAPEIESKATLKQFFITVGCIHPGLLPVEKVMVAPIPFDHPDQQPCLWYKAVINILEVTDLCSPSEHGPAMGDGGDVSFRPAGSGEGSGARSSAGATLMGRETLAGVRLGPRFLLAWVMVGSVSHLREAATT